MEYITYQDAAGNQVHLSYEDYGTGNPVVLLHGWPLSKEMWEYQIEALVAAGHRVITYDRRGFGKSSRTWGGYDYDTLADDLNALITQLILREITLVGFSMGGGEVARYFGKYDGTHVRKAVLIAAVTPSLLQTPSHPEGVPQEVFDKMEEEIKKDRLAFLDEFGKAFFGVSLVNRPISSHLLEYYKYLAAVASPRATVQCLHAFSKTDFSSDLPLINVPTLIIHGSDDKTVPAAATSELAAKLIPQNEYKVYDGAPHGLWYTDRDKLNADLLKFLN